MNCNSVKEHLVDFLYEDLAADARAAFEEHLRGCTTCRAEVAGYRRVLGNARSAFSAALAEEPPARVHNAVLEAARVAVGARTAAVARTPEEKKTEMGFFAKLWRTPWLVPAFGAASIATVVFLVRVLKDPEVIPGQRQHSIDEMAEPAAAPSAVSPSALPTEIPSAKDHVEEARDKEAAASGLKKAPIVQQKPGRRAAHEPAQEDLREGNANEVLRGEAFGALRAREGGSTNKAAGPATMPAKRKADRGVGDGLWDESPSKKGSGSGQARFAEPPPPRPAAKVGGSPSELGLNGTSGPRRAGGSRKSADLDDLLMDSMSSAPKSAEQVPAPVLQAQSARPAAPAAAPPAPSPPHSRMVDDLASERAGKAEAVPPRLEARGRAVAAPAPTPAAAPKPKAAESSWDEESDNVPMAGYDEERIESAREAEKSAKRQAAPSSEEQRRADRLFAERNWDAAAEAYRELLRRYPGHKDAAKWRERIDQSLIAARQQRVQRDDATSRVKQ
jgi:hypothetical protein